jgi:hypothetical protein
VQAGRCLVAGLDRAARGAGHARRSGGQGHDRDRKRSSEEQGEESDSVATKIHGDGARLVRESEWFVTVALTTWRRRARRHGEGAAVLLIAAVVTALFTLGFVVVATIALFAMKRLRLDAWAVLEWLGLAEAVPVRAPLRPLPTPASRRSAAVPGT